MNLENTKAQMRKGILEFCILSILRSETKYASEILDSLKKSEMLVVEGTLYPLLTRLKNAALLEYRWEESTAGPPRKYYQITVQHITVSNMLLCPTYYCVKHIIVSSKY